MGAVSVHQPEGEGYLLQCEYEPHKIFLAHFNAAVSLNLSFNHNVADSIIGDILLDVENKSVHATRENSLSIFKLHVDLEAEENHEVYYVEISTVCHFKMVRGFVAKGE